MTVARYSWDHRGRLTQVDLCNEDAANALVQVIKYTYDALDHRIRR